MFTRKLFNPASSLSAALLLGLFSHQVAAEEQTATDGVNAAAEQAQFQTKLDEYLQSMNEQIRVTLDSKLRQLQAPTISLASSETRTRG